MVYKFLVTVPGDKYDHAYITEANDGYTALLLAQANALKNYGPKAVVSVMVDDDE